MLAGKKRGSGAQTQAMTLGSNCGTVWVAAHELGHTLGFVHEMTRSDREEHVTYKEENLANAGASVAFDIDSNAQTSGRMYDFSSVMHYTGRY